ncbi:hypothetical protein SAMN05444008_10160 [Cnuella takakiae]|uniref:Uncharacterized protein n=1 Tax=Cnuella takakiae TaxID=1302690 RepID=A0A1M4SBH1_9BACT|nr:hypothetical protein SAMN05444008_10160 [Cnuella takakiae]
MGFIQKNWNIKPQRYSGANAVQTVSRGKHRLLPFRYSIGLQSIEFTARHPGAKLVITGYRLLHVQARKPQSIFYQRIGPAAVLFSALLPCRFSAGSLPA